MKTRSRFSNNNNDNNDNNKRRRYNQLEIFVQPPKEDNFGLELGNHFPALRVIMPNGASMALNNDGKIIRCVLNLSDPAQWTGEVGKANLSHWAGNHCAAGCTARAAEIIKQHKELIAQGYSIQIVVSTVDPKDLAAIIKVQTQRYKDYHQKTFNETLDDDFRLPVTFVALEAKSRQHLAAKYGHAKFPFRGDDYLSATTYRLDDNQIVFKLKHTHVDLATFDASKPDNVCAQDAKQIVEAVKSKPGVSLEKN